MRALQTAYRIIHNSEHIHLVAISAQASFVAYSAMASSSGDKQQAMTLQVEALSTVHKSFADDEKKLLKRKLEATQKDLATVRDELAKLIAISQLYKDSVEETHKRSRKKMYLVLMKLVLCEETGTLSIEEVKEMIRNLQDAHNMLDDTYTPDDDEQ